MKLTPGTRSYVPIYVYVHTHTYTHIYKHKYKHTYINFKFKTYVIIWDHYFTLEVSHVQRNDTQYHETQHNKTQHCIMYRHDRTVTVIPLLNGNGWVWKMAVILLLELRSFTVFVNCIYHLKQGFYGNYRCWLPINRW